MNICSRTIYNRKFFGKPNGTQAPAKQSKLSFSSKAVSTTPSSSSSTAKENGDTKMKDEESGTEVKPKIKKEEAVDAKENVKPGKGML